MLTNLLSYRSSVRVRVRLRDLTHQLVIRHLCRSPGRPHGPERAWFDVYAAGLDELGFQLCVIFRQQFSMVTLTREPLDISNPAKIAQLQFGLTHIDTMVVVTPTALTCVAGTVSTRL